jgi:8-oxo-dGTP diphosphatase
MAKRHWTYDEPRPAVRADLALFTATAAPAAMRLQVLLVERRREPFRGRWSLPGGFVGENEELHQAALRKLTAETGLRDVALEQVATVDTPHRDPRGHVISVLHLGVLSAERQPLATVTDTAAAGWFDTTDLPRLAFDHERLIGLGLEHLRRLGESPVCFELLPPEFTLSEMQGLCEAILGRQLDRRNFRRKVEELGFLTPVPGTRREGRHRPAQLFRFVPEKFAEYAHRRRALPF